VRVSGTEAAARIVERARRERSGELVFTIGTGCCESTAPFLYEDFWPGPDAERVGEVAGVGVFAPEYLRALYPGDDGVVIDVDNGMMAESMSIETEYGCRFVLRGEERVAFASATTERCDIPEAVSALRDRGPQFASSFRERQELTPTVAVGVWLPMGYW
jgi:uncharacterized protein (DUF779 family)